jgi:hypothetical protein
LSLDLTLSRVRSRLKPRRMLAHVERVELTAEARQRLAAALEAAAELAATLR